MGTGQEGFKKTLGWRKGEAPGNPGCDPLQRKQKRDVAELFAKLSTTSDGHDRVVAAIIEAAIDGDMKAARIYCDYRFGKPMQHIHLTAQPEEMSDEELNAEWKQIIAKRIAQRRVTKDVNGDKDEQ
jgi:hypothetical protein